LGGTVCQPRRRVKLGSGSWFWQLGSGSLVLAAWFWQSSSESVPVSRKPTIPELALSGQIHYQILQVFLTTGYTSPGYIAP
jgi:hypothetical protein